MYIEIHDFHYLDCLFFTYFLDYTFNLVYMNGGLKNGLWHHLVVNMFSHFPSTEFLHLNTVFSGV